MPLPRVGLPEDSVAGYYAVTAWRLHSRPTLILRLCRMKVRHPTRLSGRRPHRGRKTEFSHRASKTPHHTDGNNPSRLVIGVGLGLGSHRRLICMPNET